MSERSDSSNALEYVEIKLSYLENFVLELQSVVLEQGKIIDKLVGENKRMKEKVAEMANLLEGDIPNVRPPHY